jgi:hypothetical protein
MSTVAIADAYRNIVVTTGTGSGGVPGTATAHAVDAQFNLDAGFGISLVTDTLNNKVTIVNTGNGTGALTTITDSNANGNFYPIFTRGPTTTLTFTTAAGDYVSATRPANVAELRITGTINSPTGVAYALRTGLAGLLPGQTFQAVRTSDNATINFTVGTASPINGIPQSSATYSTITGYWTVVLIESITSSETYSSITIPTGVGDINPVTGTYQMDTMYLDQTTTPMSYNPITSTLTVSNVSANISATSIVASNVLIGSTANFTDWPNALLVSSQANSGDTHSYNMGIVGEAVASSSNTNIWGVGVYGKGSTNVATRSAGILGDGGVTNATDVGSAVGVRGYADDVHTGGINIGLYGTASNSSLGNYALYMNTGNIFSNSSQTWTLVDNTATALSIDAVDKTGILVVKTTDGSEGVTMSGTLSVTGHATLEGVTSTGATGTGKFVFDTTPTITGGSHTAITSLGIRDTSAAFDVTLAATSSTTLTAGRTVTLDVVNAARTIKVGGNLSFGANFTTDSNAISIATTGSTSVTLPTSGTLYGTASGSITATQLAASLSSSYYTGTVGKFVLDTNPTISGATLTGNPIISSGSLAFSGNISAAAWTTNGIRHISVPATLTDTTSTGTVANAYTNTFGGNTIAATNSVTYTNYGTMYISTPATGSNVTIINPWSIITAGGILFGGDAVGATTQNVFNTLSTTVNAFGAATTLSIGNTATAAQTVNMFTASTGASTYNFATGATLASTTKTLNIGTGGVASSTTNINIGSANGGTTTFNGPLTVGGLFTVSQTVEKFTSPTISANAVTLNFNNGAIFALGSNAANITANFTNIPGTAGQAISTTLIITQGGTAYIPNVVTINGGGNITPKWQGGSAPSGVANRTDIVSFTFVCTATNTWTVLGALVDYN